MAPLAPAADNSATLPVQAAAPLAPAPAIPPPPAIDGNASSAAHIPSSARKNRAPRRDGITPSTASISGVPPMYKMVSNIPFYTVQKKAISTFVPSFIACAYTIHQMNFSLAYTHRFLQGAPAWLPPMTFLYLGILFMIQTLRAQREVGNINDQELWLLEGFERLYDIRSLLIPGPVVPFFQSIAAFSGPFEHFGDVTPRLPTIFDARATANYALQDGLFAVLPNIPLYMDMLLKDLPTLAAPTGGSLPTGSALFALQRRYFLHNTHGIDAHATSAARRNFFSPGATANFTFTEQQYNNFIATRDDLGFPPRLDANTDGDITNLAQFMRFYPPGQENTNFYPWFGNVAAIMQRYAQFMKESVPLSAIPPAANASGLPVWKYTANTRLTTPFTHHAAAAATATTIGRPAYYEPHHLQSLSATGHHCDLSLEEITEQASAIAQINVDVATSSGLTTPLNATLRSGPVWSLPEVRSSPIIDYANNVGSTISSDYHVDTRMN